jgi:hypothetical protein
VLACAIALSAVAGAAHTPPPSALVLHRADLGRAYTGHGVAVSNSDVARGAPVGFAGKLARWGRVDGYEVDFTRALSATGLQDGPLIVTSTASVYRTAGGARASIAYANRRLVPTGYVPLALGFRVGRQARQWVRQGASGVGAVLQYVVSWREQTVDASIVLTGRVGVVSAADIAPLALRQDARIRRALG